MKLCECGCGTVAPIATQTDARAGHVRGQPMRFVRGHAARKHPHGYVEQECGYRTPCWIFQGARLESGYGWWRRGYAHRRAYEDAYGRIPDGLHIDHLCDARMCIRPDHLEAVTQAENNRRVWARGRRQPAGAAVKRRREPV